MGFLVKFLEDNKFTPKDIPEFEEKLFFEGAKHGVKLKRFAALLLLSSIIASYGVLGDSTAVVIGAMIIAPLMTPIMATAAGLVMGDMGRAGQAFLTVMLGVAGVIFTAWLISSFLYANIISFTTNSAITSRISPNLTDLFIALASGAAGAFVMSRSDVADSLPGVAISISLVPPLCVVGIGLSDGEWQVATGAMLLFVTNLLSILLAGGGLLALLGLSMASTKELTGNARRRSFVIITIGMLLVAVPLTIASMNVARETYVAVKAQRFAKLWLKDTGFELIRVDVDGNNTKIIITGFGKPPSLLDLDTDLKSLLEGTNVTIKLVPSQTFYYPEGSISN